MPRYELTEGKSAKFWQVERDGAEVTTSWGRIGTAGQSKTKSFDDEAKAQKEVEKKTAEKVEHDGPHFHVSLVPTAALPRAWTSVQWLDPFWQH